jgi:hypothetical protein
MGKSRVVIVAAGSARRCHGFTVTLIGEMAPEPTVHGILELKRFSPSILGNREMP